MLGTFAMRDAMRNWMDGVWRINTIVGRSGGENQGRRGNLQLFSYRIYSLVSTLLLYSNLPISRHHHCHAAIAHFLWSCNMLWGFRIEALFSCILSVVTQMFSSLSPYSFEYPVQDQSNHLFFIEPFRSFDWNHVSLLSKIVTLFYHCCISWWWDFKACFS